MKKQYVRVNASRAFATLLFLVGMFVCSLQSNAQTLYDSYTDGDFTAAPVWGGSTSAWTIVANSDAAAGATGSNTLRLAAPAVAGTEYLSSQISSWGVSQEWGFFVGRRAQALTAANQSYIWLYANESTLNNLTVDGYRIAIGDDTGNDEVRLEYVVNGVVVTTVITSTSAITNAITDIGFLVRVTRSSTGDWALFTSTLPTTTGSGAIATDIPNSTNANVSQGTATHNLIVPAANGYIGLAAIHSTGANAIIGVEFDQVYFTPTLGGSPTLSAGAMSAGFGSVCINTTAGPQSFSLSGTNLDGSAVTVGLLGGYSYCLTSGGTYTTTLPVAYTAPTMNATTIFVKFTPTAVQSYNLNIPVTGGGAAATSTAAVGSGVNTLPTTASGAASSIGSTSATVAGTITAVGCGTLSAYGIEYSLTNGFLNGAGTPVSSGNLSGVNFTSALSGLSPNTVYYFHSYATNSSAGTAYGTQGTFTTTSLNPPNALAASNIANSSFDANWQTVTGATSYRLDVSTFANFGFTTPATDLIISEYVEGSSSNKYIELYNGTGASVNLADYRLRLYVNGGVVPTNDVQLIGTLTNGSTIVYKNSSATIYLGTSTSNAAVNYNGNDAVALFKISTASNVDIFGRIGEDPGAGGWTAAGGYATTDKSLVRKSTVTGGVTANPGAGFPTLATEWDVFNVDDVTHLGAHSYTAFTASFVGIYNNFSVAGLTSPVSGLTANTTYYYRVRATDGTNTSNNSNVITVTTTCTAPAISACPANITQCNNHVATWTNPTATGDPAATVVCSPVSGATFATGTTTVTCTATNGCGSPSSCSFTVTINETPVISACPSNISQCDNHIATWTNPTATGTPAPTVSCSPVSGSTFSTGTTTVTCTATNSCGSNACSFTVTINETPVISACPSNISQCDNHVATWTNPTATGTPAATVSCSPVSGSTFSTGTTTVTCTATNSCGNNACSFTVTINETPVISACPSNISQCDNHVATWTNPTATGTPAASVSCSPVSGSTFSTGVTTVTCTATNSCGSNACSFTVTINETPVISACPSNISQCDNHVATWTNPTATGTPAASVSCSPVSGSTFSTGTTTVTCTATNSCGSNACSFTVTINETPVISACPSNISQCDNHIATWTDPTATGTPAATVSCSPVSGSTFGTGTTTVTCTATNSCGSNACSFTVTINETPVISACPSNISQCDNHVATWTNPTATGTPAATVSCSPVSGSTFGTGTTTVTCTATNSCGSNACSFTVTINETPVISACPSNISQCDNHVATWTDPTATGTPAASVSCSPVSGSTFSTGTTTVTCTATNSCGSNACSFTVTINETPVISACPSNISQCDNHVATWTNPTATGTPAASVSCSPVSGSTFSTGTTTVTCTATNSCGSNACSFTVTINETPVISACPSNISQCDNHVATWTNPTATGTPAASVSCSPVSGSTFSTGVTTVTCTATNSCGSNACSFTVTINETPVISACPSNISQCDNHVATWTNPTATGTPAASVSCSPVSGSTFGTGTTTVTCTATNSCGSNACSFTVTINETPVISACPSNISQCDNHIATWTDPTATGTPAASVSCSPVSGSTFGTGTTTVTCTATNSCGSNACSFTVTINETPVISACPSNISQCDNHIATWTDPTATGTPAPTVTCTPASGSTFSAGTTGVTCTATNSCGSSSCSFNVTINDSPVISACPANITTCNPVVTFSTPTATGTPAPTVTCTPASGSTFAIGTTTVTCTAVNSCGSSSCSFTVNVQTPSIAATSATSNALYGQICSPGTVTLTANGGSLGTGASWVWYDGGCGSGVSVGSGSPLTITPAIGSHNYFVRAEGACGNTACQSVAVSVISAPPSNTIGITAAPADGCVGAPAQTVSVNAVANCTFYNWTSSQAGVRFNGNPSPFQTTVPTVNVTFVSLPAAGSSGWSICVFGGNACGNTNTICTWVRATVSAPASITGSVIGCPGSSLNPYSSSAVAGAASYQWSATGGIVITGNGAQAVTLSFPGGFVSGSLSVRGQTACGYQGPNRTITITANPLIPGTISGPSYPCPNASASYSIAAVPGAANYTWTTSVPGAIVTGTTTSCSISFPASIPGGSTVSVVANSSCPTSSPTRSKGIATGLPGIPLAINGPASGQCGQTGVSYSIAPVASATGYSWSSTCGTIQGPNNLSGITMDWANNMTGCTISVISSNACGNSAPRTLLVTGAPATPAAISGNAIPCANTLEVYSASSVGATSFNWVVPAGSLILGPANGASINLLWGATSGNITVTATNGCGTSGVRSLPCVISCRQSQVNGSAAGLNAEVYPNPATEKATVKFTSVSATQVHLNMTNVLGQSVMTTEVAATEGTNMIDLDLSKIAKGVYLLNIMSGDNNEQIRVVVE